MARAAGIIVRESRPEHGTLLRIRITEEGERRLAEATRRVEAVHERMLRLLNEDERAQLTELLGRCPQALCADGQADEGPCPE